MGGKVGIGTANPGTKLEIAGTGTPTIRVKDLDGTNKFGQIFANNGALTIESRNDTSDGQIIFRGKGGGVSNEYARFDQNGNFGIGTNNPSTTLHLSSATPIIKLQDSDSTGNAALQRIDAVHSGGTTQWFVGQNSTSTTELWIQNVTNDDIRFGTNNTERVRITSGGNVGIGSALPQVQFEVYGTSPIVRSKHSTSQAYTQINHDGTVGYLDWSSGSLLFRGASNTERLRITSGGALSFTGPGSIQNEAADTVTMISGGTASNSGANIVLYGQSHASDANVIRLRTSATDRFRITSDGDVGIGTDNPKSLLHVYEGSSGNTSYTAGNGIIAESDNNVSLFLQTPNDKFGAIQWGDTDNHLKARIQYDHPTDAMLFKTNGNNERVRITSSGLLGIGTTIAQQSSAEKLSVFGGMSVLRYDSATSGPLYLRNVNFTNTTNPYVVLQDGSGNRGAIGIHNNESAMYIHGQTGIRFRYGGSSPGSTEAMRISNTGNVGVNTDNPGLQAGDLVKF